MVSEFKMHVADTAGTLLTDKTNNNYKVVSNQSTYTPTFNEDDPLNWTVDGDKLTDIESDRS
jgi:hypothetical protein